jgi:hypothetical protein
VAQGEHLEEPEAGSAAAAPDQDSSPPVSKVAQRVETVLEAAELAAAEIRKDAEQWAERHMEETRRRADALSARRVEELSSITDDLLARAHVAVRQSDELIGALEEAGRRATTLRARQAEGEEREPNASGPADKESSVSAGARLLATRMAVEGSSRGTIASRLRREFGINDPTAILRDAGL